MWVILQNFRDNDKVKSFSESPKMDFPTSALTFFSCEEAALEGQMLV